MLFNLIDLSISRENKNEITPLPKNERMIFFKTD